MRVSTMALKCLSLLVLCSCVAWGQASADGGEATEFGSTLEEAAEGAGRAPRQENSESRVTSAIYLRHIGISDKPIFPMVIHAVKPPQRELQETLGKELWSHARLIQVTETDLRAITAKLAEQLRRSEDRQKGHATGTFRVTVAENAGAKDRILNPGELKLSRELTSKEMRSVIRAIQSVEKASDTRNHALVQATASLSRRLGQEDSK